MTILPQAEADLEEARIWYVAQREELAEKFISSVEEALHQINRLPEAHAKIHKDIRRAFTRGFPFAVYYRIREEEAVVTAILHGRRDPRKWRDRT